MPNDDKKWEFGLWAVLMGVVGLVAAFAVVAFAWNDQTGAAALGAIVSPIVAIVSAYFGIQYGQKATQNAADLAKDAEAKATAAERGRERDVETLREKLMPKLEEVAGAQPVADPQGHAAKIWDEARSAIRP